MAYGSRDSRFRHSTSLVPSLSLPATSPPEPETLSPSADIWIFGYGSLMWRPDFPFVERARATVDGYHRSFCIRSTHHRGTNARPGLVLGLDRGRTCTGIAYRIAAGHAAVVIGYLRQRELIYGVYRETSVSVRLDGPGAGEHAQVRALAYVVERSHPSYAGRLPLERQARIIRAARGSSGDNLDYLFNTVRLLAELAIREPDLKRLLAIAGPVAARGGEHRLQRPSVAALRKSLAQRRPALQPLPVTDLRRFGYRLMAPAL